MKVIPETYRVQFLLFQCLRVCVNTEIKYF